MFGSRVRFSGNGAISHSLNPRWRLAALFKKNEMAKHYLIHFICALCPWTLMTADAYDRRSDTYFAREGN